MCWNISSIDSASDSVQKGLERLSSGTTYALPVLPAHRYDSWRVSSSPQTVHLVELLFNAIAVLPPCISSSHVII